MAGILKKIIYFSNQYIEYLVAFTVIAVIGIIIIPMPSPLLDLLLVLNITLSVVMFLLTLFTKNVLEFSTFPTLLLITTMFRLSLNISSTRLILSEGQAGQVIDAFAHFVTGNNYIVGAVIFIIIVIVQMLVVTSGASRVSEVSARFTLDAMPGKQMAIDADLNSGTITEAVAKKRRQDLQREASFYGAMDGASKFVKGDAIASIIITLINLVGGILIYGIQSDMGVVEALNVFGKLTIGDGLVSQLPSLLISVASGILVTRSDDGLDFGTSVTGELFGVSKAIMVASVIILLIALVPAFPTLPFLIVALILGGLGYLLMENERDESELAITRIDAEKEISNEAEREDTIATYQVEAISLEIGYGLISLVDEGNDDNLISHITAIRRQCASELGIMVNPIRIRDNLQLGPNEYTIKIKGNKVAGGEVYTQRYLIIDPGNSDFELEGIPTKEPSFGLDALWIEEADRERADLKGYTIVEPVTVLVTHLKEIIKKNSADLLGRQEVKQLLEGIKERYNVVVDELIPDILSLGEVQKVLQNLLRENVPIYDLVTILEALADNGLMTKDIELLTEQVRYALRRTIVKNYLNGDGVLMVMTVHPDLEELVANNIQKSMSGSIPVLQPDIIHSIFDNINHSINNLMISGIEPIILTSPKIRIGFRNLISFSFPNVPVLSLHEIPNDIEIEGVGQVEKI